MTARIIKDQHEGGKFVDKLGDAASRQTAEGVCEAKTLRRS